MFDFSPTGILVALAMSVWASLSSVTLAALGGALVLTVAAHRTAAPAIRGTLLGLAAGAGLFGLLWQVAAADGARAMLKHDHALALAAERERAALADSITRDLADQATRDLADAQADARNLKGLNDALAHDARRDGVCVPRDLGRRLRAL